MKNNKVKVTSKEEVAWSPHFKSAVAHTDVKQVVEELKYIKENHGEVTPALLVEASRDTKSVLHSYFEWNNQKAADAWRHRQAVLLLGMIEVKVIKEGKPLRFQAFQINRVPFGNTGDNTITRVDVHSVESHDDVKKAALRKLKGIKEALEVHEYEAVLPYLEKAIKLLEKESLVIPVVGSVKKRLTSGK